MNKLQYVAVVLLGLALTGCVSFVPSGPIGLPVKAVENTLPVGAMVKDVQITDPAIEAVAQRNISTQLTSQITAHIERGEYFQKMIVYPGKLGEKDVELVFNFTSLKGQRTPHPAYIPGALLTLTIWIWANGPIYEGKFVACNEQEYYFRD